jgi:hypothetical protein
MRPLANLFPGILRIPGRFQGVTEGPRLESVGVEARGWFVDPLRFPPPLVTTEGRAQIMASIKLSGVPPNREGSTSSWFSAQMDLMLATCPQNST